MSSLCATSEAGVQAGDQAAAPRLRGLQTSPRQVPYVALGRQFAEERERLLPHILRTLESGQWVGGSAVEQFERAISLRLGAAQAVAVGSGTDALILALRGLGVGPGHEVITPPNSFIATTGAIVAVGATPVFADVLPDQNIDPDAVAAAITPRTRALLPAHLSGRVARMPQLIELAEDHGLLLIEDAAQAVGAKLSGRYAGTFGDAGCFSAHPLKNLNAAGDAGFVLTQDEALAARLRSLRNHGLVGRDCARQWGVVSRLDSLQAAILLFRLQQLERFTEARRDNADRYRQQLAGVPTVAVPECRPEQYNVFHTFVIQAEARDSLKSHLEACGIGTAVHYPCPIHLQPTAASLGYARGSMPVAESQGDRILSLPIHPFLRTSDIDYVCRCICEFYS